MARYDLQMAKIKRQTAFIDLAGLICISPLAVLGGVVDRYVFRPLSRRLGFDDPSLWGEYTSLVLDALQRIGETSERIRNPQKY